MKAISFLSILCLIATSSCKTAQNSQLMTDPVSPQTVAISEHIEALCWKGSTSQQAAENLQQCKRQMTGMEICSAC